ncbi:sarcosine oxidase subunit delta [Rhizorhabdus sp.]|jgi:heterotetrameric sarcosine oxidase delta subunit|uniref:sarcosine oxidase subunit delta n=1 Tax=Rhizorhabdus sp. TaxID=1968843 RepID=UPI001D1F3FAD|nr:sarcosine oxidase subunit delta [Paracoccaceae bacterium]
MLRIACPYCGERDYVEFLYGGDASQTMPALDDGDIGRWTEFVFFRDNPKGEHAEFWQHQHGCRQWLKVVRHTVTHTVMSVCPAREATPAAEEKRVEVA